QSRITTRNSYSTAAAATARRSPPTTFSGWGTGTSTRWPAAGRRGRTRARRSRENEWRPGRELHGALRGIGRGLTRRRPDRTELRLGPLQPRLRQARSRARVRRRGRSRSEFGEDEGLVFVK